jgi:SAM-dependent methyltransferase
MVRHLAKRPREAGDMIRGFRTMKDGPVTLGLPWFSYGAIRFLDQYLTPDMRVLEFGSGGSTIYFANRVGYVCSVESDVEWASTVTRAVAERDVVNVEVVVHPADVSSPEAFSASPFARAASSAHFDVVVIDSYDYESHRLRPVLVARYMNSIEPGGILVLDDYWRYEVACPALPGWSRTVFTGPGPARRALTSTAIFRKE